MMYVYQVRKYGGQSGVGGEVVGFPREPVELVGSQRGVGEDKAWNGSRA